MTFERLGGWLVGLISAEPNGAEKDGYLWKRQEKIMLRNKQMYSMNQNYQDKATPGSNIIERYVCC